MPLQKQSGIKVRTTNILPGNEWVNITLTYDGTGVAQGVKLFQNGIEQDLIITKDDLQGPPAFLRIDFSGLKYDRLFLLHTRR